MKFSTNRESGFVKESEKDYLIHILEESLNEIYLFDARTLRFTYVNKGGISNIGYSIGEMQNLTPLDIMPEFDEASFQQLLQPLRTREKKKVIMETVQKRADGTRYPVDVQLQFLRDHDTPLFLAIILDVADRKEAEVEREKLMNELIQNNKDLRQFSYITSHNLRSPISNLMNLTQLLDFVSIENKNLKGILSDLKTTVRELNETVEDITQVLFIRDNPSIELEKLSFEKVFSESVEQFDYHIKESEAGVRSDFMNAPTLYFNRAYLENIFQNLISNSLKFRSPARGLVMTVSSKTEGKHIVLEFTDNGIGLDVDQCKERLFGLYQKFHQHKESKGFGLYLIRSQVEALGGEIEAEAAVDQGMTIRIRFKRLGW